MIWLVLAIVSFPSGHSGHTEASLQVGNEFYMHFLVQLDIHSSGEEGREEDLNWLGVRGEPGFGAPWSEWGSVVLVEFPSLLRSSSAKGEP